MSEPRRENARCPRVVAATADGRGLTRCGAPLPCSKHRRLDGVPTRDLVAELLHRARRWWADA